MRLHIALFAARMWFHLFGLTRVPYLAGFLSHFRAFVCVFMVSVCIHYIVICTHMLLSMMRSMRVRNSSAEHIYKYFFITTPTTFDWRACFLLSCICCCAYANVSIVVYAFNVPTAVYLYRSPVARNDTVSPCCWRG